MTSPPSEKMMASRTDEFERQCRTRGLPVTVQRRFIFQCLAGRDDHPTAEQIYDATRASIPGISRTTVYRVLETLVKIGVARRVHHQGSAARFDANVERHHHLVCTVCDRMIDFDMPGVDLALPERSVGGFTITNYSIDFQGVCADCRQAHPGKEH